MNHFEPKCVCPPPCPKMMKPVCGTDGRNYDSPCHLIRHACRKGLDLAEAYSGQCNPDSAACQTVKCPYNGICILEYSGTKCVCPTCTNETRWVCGSDHVDYRNECQLKRYSCLNRKNVRVANFGRCDKCTLGLKKCKFGAICQTRQGKAKCICPQNCPNIIAPVCGSDGFIYDNECKLTAEACRQQSNITVYSQGTLGCEGCRNVKCDYYAHCRNGECICPNCDGHGVEPVCGSDNKQYENKCILERLACHERRRLTVEIDGPCEDEFSGEGSGSGPECKEDHCYYGRCEVVNDEDTCICKEAEICSDIDKNPFTICLSNGTILNSWCQLRIESCKSGIELKHRPKEECDVRYKDTDSKYCYGKDVPVLPNGEFQKCRLGEDCRQGLQCHFLSGIKSHGYCCPDDSDSWEKDYDVNVADQVITDMDCQGWKYGCCPDGTFATGPNKKGCNPDNCRCNELGAYSIACNNRGGCNCRTGVGGKLCDRCESGYWGLYLIKDGADGCKPCDCSGGAARDDCDQQTGNCTCKGGMSGAKCNICPDGKKYDEKTGCSKLDNRCDCHPFGKCVPETASCECPWDCDDHRKGHRVCGTDSKTYDDICQLKFTACRLHSKLNLRSMGPCPSTNKRTTRQLRVTRESTLKTTESPIIISKSNEPCNHDDDCGRLALCENQVCKCLYELMEVNNQWLCTKDAWDDSPAFNENSYMKLKWPASISDSVTIKMSFKSFNDDALLLFGFDHQKPSADFIKITIEKRHIVFTLDVGAGPEVFRMKTKILKGVKHRLQIARNRKRVHMLLDDSEKEFELKKSDYTVLSVDNHFFLGGLKHKLPSKMKNRLGSWVGFVGCVYDLKVKGSQGTKIEYNLEMGSNHIHDEKNIMKCREHGCSLLPCMNDAKCRHDPIKPYPYACECSPGYSGRTCEILDLKPCASNPCQNGGLCEEVNNEFKCICPKDRTGITCEVKNEITSPSFDGKSLIVLKLNDRIMRTYFKYEIIFRPKAETGVLLYCGASNSSKSTDFFSVVLEDGYVVFRFQLGSGVTLVTSKEKVLMNDWNRLMFQRDKKQGWMELNSIRSYNKSTKKSEDMNVDGIFYVGGIDKKMSPESGVKYGFIGAIQSLEDTYGTKHNLVKEALKIQGITQSPDDPCNNSPCMNQGKCIAEMALFICKCTVDYGGRLCRERRYHPDKPVKFHGNLFLKLLNNGTKKIKAQEKNHISLMLRSTAEEGIILVSKKIFSISEDYLLLYLSRGYLQLAYNLGKNNHKNIFTLKSNSFVSDGYWHNITLIRKQRKATVQVDGTYVIEGSCDPGRTQLNTDGFLWFGGLPKPLKYSHTKDGFVGCLKDVVIEGKEVLLSHAENAASLNLEYCD
ncbi:DgyrCDS2100 [Dimorphilus gyrociliatus]|uniref:DgyrCDS2100 n=1 Tax=Dimorphilus gyrociliatus TaxID=2664684 RepID=A0A7I8VB84_9ANNE|nr:DgyrCDS2100 [Dimorphilus gyrociliatus]